MMKKDDIDERLLMKILTLGEALKIIDIFSKGLLENDNFDISEHISFETGLHRFRKLFILEHMMNI